MALPKSGAHRGKGLDKKATMDLATTPILDIDNCFQDIIVDENGEITLEYYVSNIARKKYKFKWHKDGEEIKSSRRIRIISKENHNRLSLSAITLKDQGVYALLSNHDFNRPFSKALLYIKPANPTIPNGVFYVKAQHRHRMGVRKQLISTKVNVGGIIELEVSLKEKTIEEFRWFKSNKLVKEGGRTIILNDEKNTSLSIIKAKVSDSGIYHVVGKTKYGVESSFAEVQVVKVTPDDASKSDIVPTVDETFTKTVEAYEGEETRLICKIYFDNHTKFAWSKNGKLLELRQDVQVQYYNSKYVALRFFSAKMQDAGTYQVTVTSSTTGRSDTCDCELLVKSLPIPNLIPVKIVEPLDSAVACIGSSVVFRCKFEMADSQFCCAVWEVGAYRVERSSNQFYVFCKDTAFYLLIKEVEPDMAGSIFCQICKALPSKKPVSLCTSIANLTIIPPNVGDDIATKLKVKQKKPGFYNTGIQECIPISLTEFQKEKFGPDNGSSSSTTQTDLSSKSESEGEKEKLKSKALEKLEAQVQSEDTPLDKFVVHMNQPSGSNEESVTEIVTFEVDSSSLPSPDNNDNSMIISYSKQDESVYWMEATTNRPEIFKDVTVEYGVHEDANTPSGAVQRIRVISFQWQCPPDYWFKVEVLDSQDFEGSGITSIPQFKLRDAPAERILKFRIGAEPGTNDTNSSICFTLKKKQTQLSTSRRLTILAMENYKTVFKETGDTLGRGAFGQVDLVKSFSGEYYAAKKIKTLLHTKRDKAIKEYEILTFLDHPKLVQMHLAFSGDQNLILIMDYLWGGELFERLVQEDHIKEVDVIVYVRQICEALQYIHAFNIIHMDIKPENIICYSPNTRLVKLADFGLARVLQERSTFRAMYGTKEYVAPEVLNYEPLTTACDMWSFGVITYLLLSGVMPFSGSDWCEVSAAMTRGQFNYDDPAFDNICGSAKDFINRLLIPHANSRMTATHALEHKWLKEGPSRGFGNNPLKKTRDNLRDYLAKNRDRWQKAGNVVIAAHRLRTAAQQKSQTDE